MNELERVCELCGCDADELQSWFGRMSDNEILNSCNECWPQEDNEELASRISAIVPQIDDLREEFPLYFS